MKKKMGSVVLCSILVTTTLAGCSGAEPESGSGANPPAQADGPKLTEIPLPITKEPFTINYWRANDAKLTASLQNFGEVAAYKKKAELTGITAKFTHPPLGQQKDQFNLLIATNDLPDVIYYNWADAVGGPEKMIEDGRIIRLNELIDQYAPNLKKIIESDPDVKKQITLDDGTIYMFPLMKLDALKLNATTGLILRKDWLNKLGLKEPATIDEWYSVLKAFKEKDPNGNGKADELPFTGNWGPGNLTKLHDFAPAFGIIGGFMMKGDKVAFGPVEPEYKKFLEEMAKWYKEGLVDPEILTNDGKAFDYKVTNNLAGSYVGGVFSGMGKYYNLMKDQAGFELTGVPSALAPDGKSYAAFNLNQKVLTYGEAITSSASKDKQKYIVQWMDFNYSPQGHALFNFGIEGESYTKEGDKIKFSDTILKNPKGLTYDQALASYALSIMDGPINQDGKYVDALMFNQGQRDANANWMKQSPALTLPPIRLTVDEARQSTSIMSQVNTYINETMTAIISGKKPVSEYDTMVKTIKSMGIDEAIKVHQAAYDRYSKK
ncbi:extracellular solute-binding protein [Paenibacillus mucilaginosus]|uniref:Family 1 extracellular solute-binding protein n=3 Tax=Paenibacillus mucilaginosus TaxID=61624 RepID=H6NHZ8_9BACL|nr:extracellular solute-binding protein [Paenibacillus mucilaginosus]AEI43091.1 extracellular solute-binding protein family 1 [Paenibacillus mucilaginosus KNP414]AFC30769.1 family 1 extracellular solute-binding protein [Paenibacillus mucilaginosus 3016]AFH63092.1 ABC transporter substrate-binding protein [Paenibacillus mucilaginosus K02]MCG7212334.1 extracellular solute-binding protein [Paenibacillus mucilaginosus]WDM24708.1 extracellular solute-binding protein [Paenibacillus mucilaginosus]